jgi:cysteinyl-tRNA synthetase
MIAELGSDAHAASSAADERTITPFVEALVEIRERARAQMRFEEADSIRTVLEKSGIQVSDDRDVTRWSLEKKSRPQKPL